MSTMLTTMQAATLPLLLRILLLPSILSFQLQTQITKGLRMA
jgi:hypothetical protein